MADKVGEMPWIKPPTILVVEDVPLMRDLLARILRSEGFEACGAEDVGEALEQCAAAPPELVLTDIVLPDRSGYELCAELKGKPETSDIPIIFLSALDDSGSRIAGFEAGGVDYITKPFLAREVLARVRVHLRLRRASELLLAEQRARIEELRQAQQSILVTPGDFPQGSFAVCYRPLEAVGGDFYDVLPLAAGAIGYFVADVSGHGVAASFLTPAMKALLRQYSGPVFAIEDTMRQINSAMHATLSDGHYITACYARLSPDRRRVAVVSAGHLPPVFVSDGEAKPAALASDPLGVFGSVVLHKQELEVRRGDRFYLYTDGLVEDGAMPGGGRTSGLERLRAACGRRHGLDLESAVSAIVADVKPEGSGDDLLLLGVEVRS
ncbi:MAG TPA: fused response regulator/phosphatase [Bryobacteraceae bacterium]|nr:fused response regulator/phosphatase [Bryobacteraceae bacterium]